MSTDPTPPTGRGPTLEERPGPRTYQSAWYHDGQCFTAEGWLLEEARVMDAMAEGDDPHDGPDDAGTMRAIAAEIGTLRRDATIWSEQATRQVDELARLRAALNEHQVANGQIMEQNLALRAEVARLTAERNEALDTCADWQMLAEEAQTRADDAEAEIRQLTGYCEAAEARAVRAEKALRLAEHELSWLAPSVEGHRRQQKTRRTLNEVRRALNPEGGEHA